MQETIQQIRKQLRLAMNGVVSSSMRDKGMDYKMNFGVSVPKIKEIASQYEPSEALASLLWEQDVRELKLWQHCFILPTPLLPKQQTGG